MGARFTASFSVFKSASTAALSLASILSPTSSRGLFGLEYHGICIVPCVDGLFLLLILGLELGCLLHGLLNICVRHVGAGGNGDVAALLPVPLSIADTFTMPLASISKVTSICGTPLLAGGIPSRRNWPRVLLSLANWRSPCTTWISTAVWLSAAVEKIWLFLVGMVVLLDQSGRYAAHGLDGQGSGVTSRREDVACACIAG